MTLVDGCMPCAAKESRSSSASDCRGGFRQSFLGKFVDDARNSLSPQREMQECIQNQLHLGCGTFIFILIVEY